MLQPFLCDFLSAIGAIAELSFLHPSQRRADAAFFSGPHPARRLCHGLALQRVHPAEPADGLLIEFNGLLAFFAQSLASREFLQPRLEPVAEVLLPGFLHHVLLPFPFPFAIGLGGLIALQG